MKKLISMTDFVLSQQVRGMEVQSLVHQYQERARRFYLIQRYAEFLKQPLTLGMFVPCDEDGNVLEEPFYDPSNPQYYEGLLHQYQQAKERVLFNFQGGVKVLRNRDNLFILEDANGVYLRTLKFNTKNTIESLFKFSVEITITHSAIKQIGL